MKSSREQFEERFATPSGVHWDENNQCYVCKFVSPYLALWVGWKASREALIVELPRKDPAGTGSGDSGDGRPSEEQYIAAYCNAVLAQCRRAIELAGVKVKPDGN